MQIKLGNFSAGGDTTWMPLLALLLLPWMLLILLLPWLLLLLPGTILQNTFVVTDGYANQMISRYLMEVGR